LPTVTWHYRKITCLMYPTLYMLLFFFREKMRLSRLSDLKCRVGWVSAIRSRAFVSVYFSSLLFFCKYLFPLSGFLLSFRGSLFPHAVGQRGTWCCRIFGRTRAGWYVETEEREDFSTEAVCLCMTVRRFMYLIFRVPCGMCVCVFFFILFV
jgi:hypothetical protein